ncbi:MAG TPA: hypothetical protein VJH03_10355 [Blastocatellia bacterium]|nr:hypothetical protein [Blastocatellia bacterium]
MRGYSLGFSDRHSYSPDPAITIPIILVSDLNTRIGFTAKLDTGSTYCIFEKRYADWLKLELTSGTPARISTATGSFYCYGHEVTLSVFDLEWQAVVYFAEPDGFSLNVVGRVGFLDRLQLGIVDYEQQLYLGLYDQQ